MGVMSTNASNRPTPIDGSVLSHTGAPYPLLFANYFKTESLEEQALPSPRLRGLREQTVSATTERALPRTPGAGTNMLNVPAPSCGSVNADRTEEQRHYPRPWRGGPLRRQE